MGGVERGMRRKKANAEQAGMEGEERNLIKGTGEGVRLRGEEGKWRALACLHDEIHSLLVAPVILCWDVRDYFEASIGEWQSY